MKNIYVVGGDGFAKECYQQILFTSYQDSEVVFGGFLGHNGYKVDFGNLNEYFVCDLSEFEFGKDDYAVIGAGMPDLRKKIYYDIKQKNKCKVLYPCFIAILLHFAACRNRRRKYFYFTLYPVTTCKNRKRKFV